MQSNMLVKHVYVHGAPPPTHRCTLERKNLKSKHMDRSSQPVGHVFAHYSARINRPPLDPVYYSSPERALTAVQGRRACSRTTRRRQGDASFESAVFAHYYL